jgi:hypothetical protein
LYKILKFLLSLYLYIEDYYIKKRKKYTEYYIYAYLMVLNYYFWRIGGVGVLAAEVVAVGATVTVGTTAVVIG